MNDSAKKEEMPVKGVKGEGRSGAIRLQYASEITTPMSRNVSFSYASTEKERLQAQQELRNGLTVEERDANRK